MKKLLSSSKTAVILLIVTILSLGAYVYMLARPISYGMPYSNKSEYEGVTFEGYLKFYPGKKMLNYNSNYNEEIEFFYYYKDGYIFSLMATTDAEYEEEVAYINEKFEEAVNSPFYSSTTNAFKHVNVGPDGTEAVYTCIPAIVTAIAGGVIEVLLVALTGVSFCFAKHSEKKTEE